MFALMGGIEKPMSTNENLRNIAIIAHVDHGKTTLVSAMRGAVQMISYEMSLGLCLISAVVLTGTMQISGIVEAQTGAWNWLTSAMTIWCVILKGTSVQFQPTQIWGR